MFRRLARRDLDWPRVTVTLSDERWVPPDHPDSNEGLVRSNLLSGEAARAKFVPLYGSESNPEEGLLACKTRLAAMPRPFDAVYLGLGEDGHFASLFPHDPALRLRDGHCAAVSGTPTRDARMTMTAPAILDARQLFLVFAGAEKHAVYAEAKRAGPVDALPLRLILRQGRTPIDVLTAP